MLSFPQVMELVESYQRSKILGMESRDKMPIPIADAFVILSGEEVKYDNAQTLSLDRD